MKSFKDCYGDELETARKILKKVSEDIRKNYPNNDLLNELDGIARRIDEVKDNMASYPI